MQYRRARTQGGTYFFTVVTFKRKKILCEPENVILLRNAFREVIKRHPFQVDAFVLLDEKYKGSISLSRSKKKEQSVWQRRFREHLIRDEQDFIRHVDYIHYNPVKYGLVTAPKDWGYSSFHRYVRSGVYEQEWGAGDREMRFESTIGRE